MPHRSTHLPRVELLEDRTVPARMFNRLVIDFTPDTGTAPLGQGFVARNFHEAFGPSNSRGVAPRFLDFDRDGVLTANDVRLGADAILARLREYFAPFAGQRVVVEAVDLESNTNAGRLLTRRGVRLPREQVFVLYLGGSESNPRILGRSPQAAVGYNFEGYGRVFFDTMVELFLVGNPSASPERFAAFAASVCAHEFGHQLGLGHPAIPSEDRDSVMNSNRIRFGVGDAFVNRSYLATLYERTTRSRRVIRLQNPYQELVRSFRGQPNQNTATLQERDSRDLLFANHHLPNEWGGCGCPFCR